MTANTSLNKSKNRRQVTLTKGIRIYAQRVMSLRNAKYTLQENASNQQQQKKTTRQKTHHICKKVTLLEKNVSFEFGFKAT